MAQIHNMKFFGRSLGSLKPDNNIYKQKEQSLTPFIILLFSNQPKMY